MSKAVSLVHEQRFPAKTFVVGQHEPTSIRYYRCALKLKQIIGSQPQNDRIHLLI